VLHSFLFIAVLVFARVQPTTPTPQAVEFTVTPNTIERGETVRLSWDVRGVEAVDILQYSGGEYKNSPDVRYDDLPAQGTLTVTLTDSQPTDYSAAVLYIYGADFYLLPANEQHDGYNANILASARVDIRCPYDGFFFGVEPDYAPLCPLAPAQTVDALYQSFDDGFMIWRGDTEAVYAFYVNPGGISGPAVEFTLDQYDNPPEEFPIPYSTAVSHATPADVFGKVLDLGHMMVFGMGGASASPVEYVATVQDSYAARFYHTVAYITLPDGQVIKYYNEMYGSGWKMLELAR
jgi:hypothetical protein